MASRAREPATQPATRKRSGRAPERTAFGARLRALARALVLFGMRCAIALVVLEGAASLVLFTLDLPETIQPPRPERRFTRYDPQLGWSSIPNVHVADLFGAGRGLTTNAQGFRNPRDFRARVPPDRLRLLCSGDGFTLGDGVGDADPWCAQLEALEPAFQTVNLGLSGYGIDQAYLRYAREGSVLEHDAHLFAFVREGFGRMQASAFGHYGKPFLRVERDELRVHNVPVPRLAYRVPWLVQNSELVNRLRSVELVRPVLQSLFPAPSPSLTTAELETLSLAVFENLQRMQRERGDILVLVYLPTREDLESTHDPWRRRIRSEARRRGLHLVDLVEEMRETPRRGRGALFHPRAEQGLPEPLSEAGNAWIARTLHERLRALPELAAGLAARAPRN